MTLHTKLFSSGSFPATVAAALLIGAVPVVALAQEQESQEHHQVIVRSLSDGENSHSVTVSVENGEMTVFLDGKEVPKERLKHGDGRVVILDEDGKEIESLGVFMSGEGLGAGAGTGAGGPWVWGGAGLLPQGDGGTPPPVMLGLTMSTPGPALAYHLGLEEGEGTMITGVYEGLPAHSAGLREFDLIVAIEGQGPADPGAVRKALDDLEDGDRVDLTVITRGQRKNVQLKVAAYDAEAMREAEFLGSHGPGSGFRFWTPDQAGKFRDLLVAPDHDWFRYMPDSGEIREQIQDAMRKFHQETEADGGEPQGDGLDGRLDNLTDRLGDLEKMLERFMEQAEKRRDDKK